MAFTVKSEYKRLIKHKLDAEKKSNDKRLGFECGCACGYVTRIEYIPAHYGVDYKWHDEEIQIFAIAGFDNHEKLVLTLTESDICKRYQDRKYKYWNQYRIFEVFPGRL